MIALNTTKGEKARARQRAIAKVISYEWSCDIIEVNSKTAHVPFVAVKNGKVSALIGIKYRTATAEEMRRRGTWLLTAKKFHQSVQTAKRLGIPLVYVVEFAGEIHFLNIYHEGKVVPVEREAVTKTQKTVNGGKAERLNVFISFEHFKKLKHE